MAAVHTMAACYRRDRLHSNHHEDRFSNIQFDVERFIRYSHFLCEIREERDDSCFQKQQYKLGVCFTEFKPGRAVLRRKLRTGVDVTVAEACRVHDKLTNCIIKLFAKCPLERRYFLAHVCAHVPSSCNCPLHVASTLEGARLAMSSSTSGGSLGNVHAAAALVGVTYMWL